MPDSPDLQPDATPRPLCGVGLGLRSALADELLERRPEEVRWLEIHPENYVSRGGRFRDMLGEAREHWALTAHGLTQCFGSLEPFEVGYTRRLRAFLEELGAPWYSDHLCFGGVPNAHLHDLLPLPRTAEAVELAARRIRELQDALGLDVAIENVSTYAEPAGAEMDEVDFVLAVAERADAKLLLDVNNVFVNSRNFGFSPFEYIARVPPERVVQLHVAGHFERPDGLLVDTHGEAVRDEVYELVAHTLRHVGHVPVLLERDGNYPPLDELLGEVRALSRIYDDVLGAP